MIQKQAQKSEHDVQAEKWAAKYGVRMSVVFLGHYAGRHDLHEEKQDPTKKANTRDHYEVTLERVVPDGAGQRTIRESFQFGQSLVESAHRATSRGPYWSEVVKRQNATRLALQRPHKGKEPSLYTVLACLQRYEPGTFRQFCGDFGYSTDSLYAREVYEAVQQEFEKVCHLCFDSNDMLTEWQEIS